MFRIINATFLFVAFWAGAFAQSFTNKNAEELTEIGLDFYKKSELDKALHYLDLAKTRAAASNDTTLLIKIFTGIGKVYSDKAENPTALSHYHKALTLAEKKKDSLNIALTEKNIGVLYITWKNFDRALQHYEIAQGIALKIGNDKIVADCYNNKGTVYEQLLQYPRALAAYNKALSYYQKNESLAGIAMSYANIAIVYKQQKQYQQAVNYNFKALDIMRKMDEKWMQAATLNNIGSVYFSMKDYENTVVYCEQSLKIAKAIKAKEIEVAAYETAADAAAAKKDFVLAYQYMSKFHKASQDFINTEKTHQFSELEIKYKTEKKEQKIALLSKQAIIHKLQIDKRNQTIMVLGGILLLIFIIGYQYLKQRKLQQQTYLQAVLSQQQEQATRAVIEAEENERKRIAVDLHDGVGQMLSVVNMNMSTLLGQMSFTSDGAEQTFKKTMNLMAESTQEMRTISHQMMPDALLKNGLVNAIENFISMIDINVIDIVFSAYGIEKRLDRNIEIMLYRVIQEAVNNVIKHAQAKHFDIQLALVDEQLTCTIEDDGKGFEQNVELNGIGLQNMKSRINFVKGNLELNSQPGSGTLIFISIPV